MDPKSHPKSAKKRIRKQRGPAVQGGGSGRSVGGPGEVVGGSGVDPGWRGRGGGKPPPEYRREDPGIHAVNERGLIRPVPRGYGGFKGLRHCRRPPQYKD